MTLKKVYLGAMGPYVYDTAAQYPDQSSSLEGIRVEGQMLVDTAPTNPRHVVRLQDLAYSEVFDVSVADIDDPVELSNYDGSNGKVVYARKEAAGVNSVTLYLWDQSVVGGAGSPYEVAAKNTGKWIAIAGKYCSQDLQLGAKALYCGSIHAYDSVSLEDTLWVGKDANVARNAVINSSMGDYDTKIGSIATSEALKVDAALNQVQTHSSTKFISYGNADFAQDVNVTNKLVVNSGKNSWPLIVYKKTSGVSLFVDTDDSQVGVGTDTPGANLDVVGTGQFSDTLSLKKGIVLNTLTGSNPLSVRKSSALSSSETNVFTVDPANGRVGVLEDSPAYTLDIGGNAQVQGILYGAGRVVVNNSGGDNYLLVKKSGGAAGFQVNPTGEVGVNSTPVVGKKLFVNGDAMVYGSLAVDTDIYSKTVLAYRSAIFNQDKGAYDLVVHGNSVDSLFRCLGTTNEVVSNGATTVYGSFKVANASVKLVGLPTSAAGLTSGQLYSDAGTIKIVA